MSLEPYFFGLLASLVVMHIGFRIAQHNDKVRIVDSFWAPAIFFAGLSAAIVAGQWTARAILVLVLVGIWMIRLSTHISVRSVGKPEDYRYAKMRKGWKHEWLSAYFRVFILQGVLAAIIALPIMYIQTAPYQGLVWLDYVGAGLWLVGFLWESIGDYQLAQFQKHGKTGVIQSGLWKLSRHPNYFGEILQWWSIGLLAVVIPGGWKMLISPLLITLLIRYVSGVPLLENKFMKKKAYREYAKRTPMLIPNPFLAFKN